VGDNTRNVPPVRHLCVKLTLFHGSTYNLAEGDERDAMAIALRHTALAGRPFVDDHRLAMNGAMRMA
jgi:hypothetical protein